MHPVISYDLAQDRIADLHHQAQRDALARTAREACRRRRHQSDYPLAGVLGFGRLLLAALGARST
jgi:hypothetical protein